MIRIEVRRRVEHVMKNINISQSCTHLPTCRTEENTSFLPTHDAFAPSTFTLDRHPSRDSNRIERDGDECFHTIHRCYRTIHHHCAPGRDLFVAYAMRPATSAPKKYSHLEYLLDRCVQLPILATNVHIASVWLPACSCPTTTPLAVRASDPLEYSRSVQSGSCSVPSMWFHRLSPDKIFPDEEMDARLFHRPVDREWTPHHSRLRASKMGRVCSLCSTCFDCINAFLGTQHTVAESVSVV